MKLFLIKVGKAFSVIKRDGLINGGRRVISAFFALFGRVSPADVLFIAGGVGDATRYGCHHQMEELELQGIKCSFTVQDNPLLPNYADKFKVFIFHRTLFSSNVEKLIKKAKQQGKEILYATDDLFFDAQYFKYMNWLKNANALEKKLYEKGVGEEIVDDPYVKCAVTTTDFLAEKLALHGKKVFVSLNKMSQWDVDVTEKLLKSKKDRNDGLVRVGYFSGTMSHNKDFAEIDDLLVDLLEKYPQMRLMLVGHLDVDHKLNKFNDKIQYLPFVPREKHFENISNVDINLAPLEKDNPFCEAKSELKFFEAGILGIPTVASGTRAFRDAITDGVDGFVAVTTEQWREKLSKLIEDASFRQKMGANARKTVLEKYVTSTQKGNKEYYQYLKERSEKGSSY